MVLAASEWLDEEDTDVDDDDADMSELGGLLDVMMDDLSEYRNMMFVLERWMTQFTARMSTHSVRSSQLGSRFGFGICLLFSVLCGCVYINMYRIVVNASISLVRLS